jgi:hypothetical protein
MRHHRRPRGLIIVCLELEKTENDRGPPDKAATAPPAFERGLMKRTIICLGAKRSGTTAIHQMFREHPDAGVCHPNQSIANWEPCFWSYAAAALEGGPLAPSSVSGEPELTPLRRFIDRMGEIAPALAVPSPLTEQAVFDLWDAVLGLYGPIVFDKTPSYLSSREGLDLLLKYREAGHDVRIFGIVRDPRDVIASQHDLWYDLAPERTPEVRETAWVTAYRNFERVRERLEDENCPLFRYEEFSADPGSWAPRLLEYCGLAVLPNSYAHIRPVSIGRFFISGDRKIHSWVLGEDIRMLAARYGYDLNRRPGRVRCAGVKLKAFLSIQEKRQRRFFSTLAKRGIEMILFPIAGKLSTLGFEQLLTAMVAYRSVRLPAEERARFLMQMENRLHELQEKQQTK